MGINGYIILCEDYVSFETAKLLKEKGFPQEYDIYHSMVYNEEDYEDECEVQRMVIETKLVKAGTLFSYPVGVPEPKCYCPTLQMAMKWLRVVHNVDICAFPCYYNYNSWGYDCQIFKNKDLLLSLTQFSFFEEAVETAIEAALKYYLEN
jgi:hypothetical protein